MKKAEKWGSALLLMGAVQLNLSQQESSALELCLPPTKLKLFQTTLSSQERKKR